MTKPKIFTLSAPSGTGKNTVLTQLLKTDLPISRMQTMTSRSVRPTDHPGEYIFVSREQFQSAIENSEMIEWVEYNNNLYGTRTHDLQAILSVGRSPIMQIDVRGATSFKTKFPNTVSIFLSPDNLEVLHRRLTQRGMAETDIVERLDTAKHELTLAAEFDYRVANLDGRLSDTVTELSRIISSEIEST